MLTATYRATEGTMVFDGQDLGSLSPHEVTRLGLVRTFQNIRLFPNMTRPGQREGGPLLPHSGGDLGRAHAACPGRAARSGRSRSTRLGALEFVGIMDRADELAKSLPYGDQKLLEIARAMATGPRMILLDEPAAGLNSSESADLVRLVRKIRSDGVTVMLIEHDMKVVMDISERIIVLDHGVAHLHGHSRGSQA